MTIKRIGLFDDLYLDFINNKKKKKKKKKIYNILWFTVKKTLLIIIMNFIRRKGKWRYDNM